MDKITRILSEKMFQAKGDKGIIIDTFLVMPISDLINDFEGNEIDTKMMVLRELKNVSEMSDVEFGLKMYMLTSIYADYYNLTKEMVIEKINSDVIQTEMDKYKYLSGEKDRFYPPIESMNERTGYALSRMITVLENTQFIGNNDTDKLIKKFLLKANQKNFDIDEIVKILDSIENDKKIDINDYSTAVSNDLNKPTK